MGRGAMGRARCGDEGWAEVLRYPASVLVTLCGVGELVIQVGGITVSAVSLYGCIRPIGATRSIALDGSNVPVAGIQARAR